jgi:acetylornithine deacetylase
VPSELTALLSELVAIDSVNPSLVPGGAGEAEAAAFVARWGRAEGLEAEVVGDPDRPSVVLRRTRRPSTAAASSPATRTGAS